MIAILAEKPSVGKDIARVLKVAESGQGYLYGNGYIITWALGHLVSLALPTDYGPARLTASDLPIVPDPFRLVVRRKKTAKGTSTDSAAYKQLKVIRQVFDQCQSIIVATDAGREGELIFRYIYTYLECRKPFQRLWINSLTDGAILAGFSALQDGSRYDNLYRAADCRAKADWLIGINASQALCLTSGMGNNSLGRVQTPTLAMVCSRYLERRDFKPTDYWQLKITLKRGEHCLHFSAPDNIADHGLAEAGYARLKTYSEATIARVERKAVKEPPPLLYDLTALQKDASIHHDLSAERTLELAQRLYEKKLISYPRTGSRYIPQDVLSEIPSLLEKIGRLKAFSPCAKLTKLSYRSVNDGKVTDHHALITTGIPPENLQEEERWVYHLIAGRMLEAFSPECRKETLFVEATCGGQPFLARGSRILSPGWRGVYNRPREKEEGEEENAEGLAAFRAEEAVPVSGYNLVKKKTLPKPLHTEATLLTAMENAGRELIDQGQRAALKEIGIGTPATRASIIGTLFARDYIERSGKSLQPTQKGLYVYRAVKSMRIANVELTGSCEKSLADIEQGVQPAETFDRAIEVYTRQVTSELLSLRMAGNMPGTLACPKCKEGRVGMYEKVARCSNQACRLIVFRRILNKELTDKQLEQLFTSGFTQLIKGFKGKKGNLFDACISFDKGFSTTFSFPDGGKSGEGGNSNAGK